MGSSVGLLPHSSGELLHTSIRKYPSTGSINSKLVQPEVRQFGIAIRKPECLDFCPLCIHCRRAVVRACRQAISASTARCCLRRHIPYGTEIHNIANKSNSRSTLIPNCGSAQPKICFVFTFRFRTASIGPCISHASMVTNYVGFLELLERCSSLVGEAAALIFEWARQGPYAFIRRTLGGNVRAPVRHMGGTP